MPDLTIVSFNCHAGLQARRNGVCEPYDLDAVHRGAEATGATVHELHFGRAKLDPWPHVPRDGGGRGTVGIAILSRVPTEVRGRLAVGTVAGDPTPERGGLLVTLDVEGTEVDLVGVHLSSRLPYGPPIQLRRLHRQLPDPARPAIVAGDCNFWGPGVQAFLPGWRRTVRGRTWPASWPHSQIDHILVRPGTEVVDAEVLPAVGSDHRPVRATLRVR